MPYCVARSVGFASAFAGSIAQKLNSALELELEAWGGKEDAKMLIFVKMLIAALHIPLNSTPAHGWRRRREASQSKERAGHCRLCLAGAFSASWFLLKGLQSERRSLLTLSTFLGELFAVLVSVLAGDYAGRENKQLCHPSVHTNTLPGADCTVGKMTPKLCVMSRKRLETALAMLKIDISGGGKKKKESKKKNHPLY